MQHFIWRTVLFLALIIGNSLELFAQISSPAADYTQPTQYTNGMADDEIFVFCSPDINGNVITGSLNATPTIAGPGFTFEWGLYDENTHTYTPFFTENGATSSVSNLASGGYSVTITNNAGDTETFITWVYVSIVDVDISLALNATNPGCEPFDVNGTIDASGFTYWDPVDPGAAPFIVDANTVIEVCFNANHTYVSDLGFVLVGPPSCGSPGVTLSPNPQVINNGNGCCCNSGNNINNLCFSTANTNQLNMCSSGTPLSGTYGFYNGTFPGTGGGNYPQGGISNIYGCNAAEGGWAIQIYDCIGADVGSLTGVTITFSDGTSTINYASGGINSAINDNSCTPGTASIYVVPLTTPINPNPQQVPNSGTLTYQLGLNGVPVTLAPGTNTFTQTVDPVPTYDEWYYLFIQDQLGCSAIDSVLFEYTPYADASIIDPIPNYPNNTFCVNDAPEQLTSVEPGGSWTGPGVSVTGLFDPSIAGVGNHSIIYDIPDPCGNNDAIDIIVFDLPDASINNINPTNEICGDAPPVQITTIEAGGTFSGNGVSITGLFDPSTVAEGAHTITYSIGGNCPGTETMDITVLHVNDATINPVNATNSICLEANPVQLTAVDAGGTWSGTGISPTGMFDPATAGVGTHTITCSIADPCGDVQSMDIEVVEITFTQVVRNASCFGTATGEILIENETGTAPHFFSIDGGNTTQTADLFQNLSANNYNLVVEDANGCVSQPVQVTINEPTAIVLIATMDQQSNCNQPDGVVSVVAAGGVVANDFLYNWDSTPAQSTATANGLVPAIYTVTVTDDNGCTETANIEVTSTPGFTATITSSIDANCYQSCDGEATVVANAGTVLPVTYSWNTVPVQNTITATALCAGTYDVTVTDNVGCVATANIIIGEPTELVSQVSASASPICIGQSSDLISSTTGGTQPYTNFFWTATPADGTLTSNQENPTVSPVETTVYTLVSTDDHGCTSAPQTVTVEVLPPLNLDIIRPLFGLDTGICPYDFATLDLQATGGDGNYNYFLSPSLTPASLPMVVQPATTAQYDFTVTDGCTTPSDSATTTVTVFLLPTMSLIGDDTSGCHTHTVEFTDLSSPTPVAWNWDFGDPSSVANTATISNPTHIFSGAGLYDISLTVETADGCVNDITYPNYIEVFPLPVASFVADPDKTNVLDAQIQFTDLSTGDIDTWSWDFGTGDLSAAQHPAYMYADTGTFIVTLNVLTVHDCPDMARRQVIIEPDFMFYVPNSFTPNSDGKNDSFRGYGEGVKWDTYELYLFNRWGEEIFFTHDIDEPWRGWYKNAEVEAGVYVWKINIYDLKGELHTYNGHVTLLR